MKRRLSAFFALVFALLATIGCATLEEKQRAWIFQPSDQAWGGSASMAEGMDDVWIDFKSRVTGEQVRLHGLWLEAEKPRADTPVLLYLHGARWNVAGSSGRMRRMQELGFSVLAIDYRGFGKSTPGLPSEEMSYEDARHAWEWLAKNKPGQPRYIFGHSLGGAIAIDLAANVEDEQGTIVEGTFTSIPDVASSFKWGWLPIGPFITQRFAAVDKVERIGSPLLVVHGANDTLIRSELGQKLFERAKGKKRFVLVDGGSHHSTMWMGRAQYREAVQQLFSLR
jgi:alpha-beta hydrolase superfamily lysophospholipase